MRVEGGRVRCVARVALQSAPSPASSGKEAGKGEEREREKRERAREMRGGRSSLSLASRETACESQTHTDCGISSIFVAPSAEAAPRCSCSCSCCSPHTTVRISSPFASRGSSRKLLKEEHWSSSQHSLSKAGSTYGLSLSSSSLACHPLAFATVAADYDWRVAVTHELPAASCSSSPSISIIIIIIIILRMQSKMLFSCPSK